jgi:hypothetical protein
MTDDLSDRLTALADRAPARPLDVAALSRTARRRRQRRALVAAAPVAALLLVVLLAWTHAGGVTDRISQQAGPGPTTPVVPISDLQASVEAEVVRRDLLDGEPALSVTVDPPSVALGSEPATVRLGFSALTGREASFLPLTRWSAAIPVDGAGSGALGLSGVCGARWDDAGQREEGCVGAPLVVSTVEPGRPQTAVLQLYARVGDQQTKPGLYRAEVALDDEHLLRLVVGVRHGPFVEPTEPPTPDDEPPAGTAPIRIFLLTGEEDPCGGAGRFVERRVPATEAVATAALRKLFAGATAEEKAAGLSGFGHETAGLLRSVRIEDGTAYVDLVAALLPDSVGTSCGGTAFQVMVGETLLQFPTIERYVVALDGDPRAFVEVMQGGCEDPVEPGGPCDPAPFRPRD